MKTTTIRVETGRRPALVDLTGACERFVAGEGDGVLTAFVPHATAGILVMELHAGSEEDVLATVERLLPHDARWTHRHGSPGHGADHVLPLLVPPSVSIPVVDGHLLLGTWQSVALLDTNADNSGRSIHLAFVAG